MPRGRLPKDPVMRAGHGDGRRAEAGRRAILPADANAQAKVPPLPPHPLGEKWHPLALQAWDAIWRSPQAGLLIPSDVPGLFRYIVLYQAFLADPRPSISSELRALASCFGLSPLDRRRLEYVVIRADEAVDAAPQRRDRAARIIDLPPDPRDVLK